VESVYRAETCIVDQLFMVTIEIESTQGKFPLNGQYENRGESSIFPENLPPGSNLLMISDADGQMNGVHNLSINMAKMSEKYGYHASIIGPFSKDELTKDLFKRAVLQEKSFWHMYWMIHAEYMPHCYHK